MEEYDSLADLAGVLEGVSLPLELPGAGDARQMSSRGVRRLEDHILPRLSNLDAPLLCVVGGSTGAGKSTIVNSLVNQTVTASSARRPTTRRPLLLHRPEDARWFEPDRILPTLPRRRIDADAPPSQPTAESVWELELRSNEAIRPGLALLDAPDLDSVVEDNRMLARQLLDAADLWVFVTTAARYADAVPWKMLEDAAKRNIAVAVVLNRVPANAVEEVRADLSRMLADANLGRAPLIAIEETILVDGMIPHQSLLPLTNWLSSLTDTAQSRAATAKRTLHGSVFELLDSVDAVVQALAEQATVATDAAQVVDAEIDAAVRRVAEQTQNGSLLRGEVLARWQEVVGTAELSRKIDEGISWVKARITGFLTGRPVKTEPVEQAIGEGLTALLSDEIARAHDSVRSTWSQSRAMRDVEAHVPAASAREINDLAAQMTRQWQKQLLDMVRDQAGSRKMSARFLAIGVNVLGVALMIVIFASTGGLTGAEVGVAGATSVLAQRLLESVFGDQAVQSMTKQAHRTLLDNLREVLAESTRPFLDAVPRVSAPEPVFEAAERARAAWEGMEVSG
ncbi:MAG: GTPase domain-containing protein [Actinomycetaceae bacterium]|nr:GTPase domain-containing protein [Actinomycetaceae bacterium]